jgi:hypothetical protein
MKCFHSSISKGNNPIRVIRERRINSGGVDDHVTMLAELYQATYAWYDVI